MFDSRTRVAITVVCLIFARDLVPKIVQASDGFLSPSVEFLHASNHPSIHRNPSQ